MATPVGGLLAPLMLAGQLSALVDVDESKALPDGKRSAGNAGGGEGLAGVWVDQAEKPGAN